MAKFVCIIIFLNREYLFLFDQDIMIEHDFITVYCLSLVSTSICLALFVLPELSPKRPKHGNNLVWFQNIIF